MRQVIRLTESDLHRMIKESVREILNEGQGLDFVKKTWEDTKDKDYRWGKYKDAINRDDFSNKVKDFIKKGNIDDEDADYYSSSNPELSGCERHGDKRINKTFGGKIGRAAGLGAGMAVAGFNAAKNSMRKRFNNR